MAMHATCAGEGCDTPIAWTEVHHVDPWAKGGKTDLKDLIPLCRREHHMLHSGQYLHRVLPNGKIRFTRRCQVLRGLTLQSRMGAMVLTLVEVRIAGRPPHQVRQLARERSGTWWRRGLIFRVKDDYRVWAWVNERSRWSTAPVLKGRLAADADDTLVTGAISWRPLIGGIGVCAIVAVLFLTAALWRLVEDDPALAVFCLGAATFFGGLGVVGTRSFRATQMYEQSRLTAEIQRMFALRG